MALISSATPLPSAQTTSATTSSTEPWWQSHGLIIAPIVTWISLAAALVFDLTDALPGEAVLPLYILAYLAGGSIATKAAIDDLRQRTVNIDLLMVTAAIGAALIGAWAEGAMLLALFSTSNALEHVALGRTRSAVRSLMDLTPPTARRLHDGSEQVIDISLLVPGDLIVIRPGEKIPADAEVVTGQTAVDQAAITGESMPVSKETGDTVFAGTINGSGAITARVTHASTETTISRIARLVESAQEQKSPAERFTDSFEGPYAIGVIVFATLVGIIPILFGASSSDAFYRAITLLVVASPCALVISTPAATLSAIARAARAGVLVKGGSHLDALGTIDTIAFDKTGTLTVGKPVVTDMVVFGEVSEDDALRDIASVEHMSEHPIARAIVEAARSRQIELATDGEFSSDPGQGVVGTIGDHTVAVGNEMLFAAHQIELQPEVVATLNRLRSDGRTAVVASSSRGYQAVVGVADQLRPEAAEAIQALRKRGVRRLVMLTGDNELVGRRIGTQLGLDEVHADLQPEDKLRMIEKLKSTGKVAMVGDGVNDAPALATADLGVAMGIGGTDVALETADVVLVTSDLRRIDFAVGLSRRMRRVIRMSIAFALSVIAVLITTTLVSGIPLTLGVFGHEGSTVIVVLAGLTLLGYGTRTPRQPAQLATAPAD